MSNLNICSRYLLIISSRADWCSSKDVRSSSENNVLYSDALRLCQTLTDRNLKKKHATKKTLIFYWNKFYAVCVCMSVPMSCTCTEVTGQLQLTFTLYQGLPGMDTRCPWSTETALISFLKCSFLKLISDCKAGLGRAPHKYSTAMNLSTSAERGRNRNPNTGRGAKAPLS